MECGDLGSAYQISSSEQPEDIHKLEEVLSSAFHK